MCVFCHSGYFLVFFCRAWAAKCWGPCVFCGVVALSVSMFVMLLTDIALAIGSSRLSDCEVEVCDDGGCGCMGSSIGCVRR